MTEAGRLRVLVCDDAMGFPQLVELWLREDERTEPAGIVVSATELREQVGGISPDVLVLDLMLPEGPSTPELVASVRDQAPGVRIVLVSNMPDDRLAEEAERLAVDTWCGKASPAQVLLDAICGQEATESSSRA